MEQKLAYTDFLALLIEDEIARREQRKLVMRQRRAGINTQKTLESYDFTFNLGVNQAQVMDLATCRYLEEKVPVLIVGPCGTGKSHLTQALGHIAVRRGYDTVFSTHAKLLGQIASARAVGTYERKLAALTKSDLLIIDDFGFKPMRPGQDEDFHDVIAERYERKPTIITSNLDFWEWNDAFHNKLLGAATLDRISRIKLGKFLSVRSRPSAPLKGSTSNVQWTGQWTGWTGKMKFEILGLESCLR